MFIIHTSGPNVRCDEDISVFTVFDTLLCLFVCVYQPKFSRFDSDVYKRAAASAPEDVIVRLLETLYEAPVELLDVSTTVDRMVEFLPLQSQVSVQLSPNRVCDDYVMIDGLLMEFYSVFWLDIGHFLARSIQASFERKAFLKIEENTRLVYDLIQYCKKTKREGIILLIDFEKAFDSIEWSYIDKVLSKYNFGSDIRKWFRIVYNNSQICVIY